MPRQAPLVAVAVILALGVAAPAALAAPAKPYDFNGDGRQELVVTMPQWGAGDGTTGANIIVRTGRKGLRHSAQVVSLDTPGIKRFPGRGHGLGGGAASGDFDGDGYADLAMAGYPGIVVVFGSPHGLDAHRSQTWGEPHTRFHDPAAGDVNRDGF